VRYRPVLHRYLPPTLIFGLGIAARLALPARAAGFDASAGYDQGVYYAASVSLLHGRIPYRDFVLLHPPVVMLMLLPAALLGHWTSDHAGYLAANVGVSIVGAFNGVLVYAVARRLGLGRRAATIGGLLYAVWFTPVGAEYSLRLEPLGNFFLLLALLALIAAFDQPAVRRRTLLFAGAGALFGTATSVKIWFVVPMLVAIVWVLVVRRSGRDAGLIALGVLAAGVLLDLPFLIASRGEMWTMVVSTQVTRTTSGYPWAARLLDLAATYWPQPDHFTFGYALAAVVGLVVLGFVLVSAWRVPAARPVVTLAALMILTLVATPSWFEWYGDFAAGPVAICAAASAQALRGRLRVAGWLPTAAAAGVTLTVLVQGAFPATVWWGPDAMIAAARHARCVTSDAPAGLIALDALDRDLHNGCQVWVDAVGRAYLDTHQAGDTLRSNQIWQRKVVRYLRSGDLAYPYMLRHPLAPRSRAVIARGGVALRMAAGDRTFVLYYVRHGRGR
jgi:alpha-1,2-mannosyltransferase